MQKKRDVWWEGARTAKVQGWVVVVVVGGCFKQEVHPGYSHLAAA